MEGPRTRHGASSGLHANRRLQLQPPPTPATVPSGCTHHDRERRETRDEKESRRTADLRVTREVDPGSHAATSLTPPASLLHSTRGSPVNLNGSCLVVWEGHNSQDSLRKPDTLLCSITLSCHPLSSRERAADACLDHSTVLREPTNLRPYITHHIEMGCEEAPSAQRLLNHLAQPSGDEATAFDRKRTRHPHALVSIT